MQHINTFTKSTFYGWQLYPDLHGFLIPEHLSSTENSSDELNTEKMSKLRFTFTCQVVRKFY